jgi:hypothetical protein
MEALWHISLPKLPSGKVLYKDVNGCHSAMESVGYGEPVQKCALVLAQ